jgi:hypothetical protein
MPHHTLPFVAVRKQRFPVVLHKAQHWRRPGFGMNRTHAPQSICELASQGPIEAMFCVWLDHGCFFFAWL